MAYKVHVRPIDEATGKPYSKARIERELPGLAAKGYIGSRHGVYGIVVERKAKSAFESAVAEVARFALDTGYRLALVTTSTPSTMAAGFFVRSFAGRGAKITIGRG